jgi:hypothetical protein
MFESMAVAVAVAVTTLRQRSQFFFFFFFFPILPINFNTPKTAENATFSHRFIMQKCAAVNSEYIKRFKSTKKHR